MKRFLTLIIVASSLHAMACKQNPHDHPEKDNSHLIALFNGPGTQAANASGACKEECSKQKPVIQTKTYTVIGMYQLKVQYYQLDCTPADSKVSPSDVDDDDYKPLAKKKGSAATIGGGFIFDVI